VKACGSARGQPVTPLIGKALHSRGLRCSHFIRSPPHLSAPAIRDVRQRPRPSSRRAEAPHRGTPPLACARHSPFHQHLERIRQRAARTTPHQQQQHPPLTPHQFTDPCARAYSPSPTARPSEATVPAAQLSVPRRSACPSNRSAPSLEQRIPPGFVSRPPDRPPLPPRVGRPFTHVASLAPSLHSPDHRYVAAVRPLPAAGR
jgi:hypothetical protein